MIRECVTDCVCECLWCVCVAEVAELRSSRAVPTVLPMTSLRLSVEPPSTHQLERYASKCQLAQRPFNHGFHPRGTRPEPVGSLRIIEEGVVLGKGRNTYFRAKQLLLDWRMHHGSESTGIWTDVDGNALVTYARLCPCLWVLNPCRTLDHSALPNDRSICNVAYATTRGHLIAGCELMTVRLCSDGRVRFDVFSGSRGSGLLGRMVFPFIVPSQRRFFEEQVRCMERQFPSPAAAAKPRRS